MAVTRADVARRAGVSASTVSYVLNGARPISTATRDRVREAIRELGYTPNAFAQGLARSWAGIVGLHWPVGERALSSTELEYISAISVEVRRRGFHLLLWSNPLEDTEELRLMASQGLVDGILLMEVRNDDPRVPILDELGVRYVLVGRSDKFPQASHVDADFEAIAELALGHATDLGHRDVALLTQPADVDRQGYGPVTRLREYLQQAASQARVDLTVVHAQLSIRGGHEAYARIRAYTPAVTCVLEVNEPATIGLLEASSAAGRAVPQHLSVIALNQGRNAVEMAIPALTDVSAQPAAVGRRAVSVLIDDVESVASPARGGLVAPVLTVRESTARA